MAQSTSDRQLRGPSYGLKTRDLSVDREAESDFELIRFPNSRALTPIDVPDECYLRFGDKNAPRLDLRDFVGQRFDVLAPNQTLGAVYLENPAGASGTLRLFHGAEVGVESSPEIGEIGTITSTVSVQEDNPLDASGATVSVQEATPLAVQEATPLDVSGAVVTIVEGAALDVSAATVPVEQQTPVAVEGTVTTDSPDTTTATAETTANATNASLDVGDGRTAVSFAWDVSGAATLTIEGSHDGTNWFDIQADVGATDPAGAEALAVSYVTGFDHVRIQADTAVNRIAVSAKGA